MVKMPNIEKGNKDSMQKVARDQQFYGMLLMAAFIGEPKSFAIKCFERFYPDELNETQLYDLSLKFYATYYGEQ